MPLWQVGEDWKFSGARRILVLGVQAFPEPFYARGVVLSGGISPRRHRKKALFSHSEGRQG